MKSQLMIFNKIQMKHLLNHKRIKMMVPLANKNSFLSKTINQTLIAMNQINQYINTKTYVLIIR